MAQYVITSSYSVTERLMATIGLMFERAAARLAHHRIYRLSLSELSALSDRELTDLGLSRSMLKSVALEAADKKIEL